MSTSGSVASSSVTPIHANTVSASGLMISETSHPTRPPMNPHRSPFTATVLKFTLGPCAATPLCTVCIRCAVGTNGMPARSRVVISKSFALSCGCTAVTMVASGGAAAGGSAGGSGGAPCPSASISSIVTASAAAEKSPGRSSRDPTGNRCLLFIAHAAASAESGLEEFHDLYWIMSPILMMISDRDSPAPQMSPMQIWPSLKLGCQIGVEIVQTGLYLGYSAWSVMWTSCRLSVWTVPSGSRWMPLTK